MHILGTTGQGKSRLIAQLIIQDLKQGRGVCLLDPSDNGDTMYHVLKWCIKNDFNKICLIEPHDREKYVTNINPKANLLSTVQIQFDTRAGETPAIEKYLPATIRAIRKSKNTLAELTYFTDPRNIRYAARRNEILGAMDPLDRNRIDLESVFRPQGPSIFQNLYGSTIRRFEPFLEETMYLMFGSSTGVPFQKMIKYGWLILCNLDAEGVSPDFDNRHQRLIGTTVLHELFRAVHGMRANGWKGTYYIYIDEVGDYATRTLANILYKKRKSGIRLVVAHQNFTQLEDPYVRKAVLGATNIKVLFQTPDPEDVMTMARMMYGGALPAGKVEYVLRSLAKGEASIKIGKTGAVFTTISDVPDIDVSKAEIREFKNNLYSSKTHYWYKTPAEVLKEINDRFKETESPTITPTKQKPPRTGKRQGAVENEATKSRSTENPRDIKGRTIFDDLPTGPSILRRTPRRKRTKPDEENPESGRDV